MSERIYATEVPPPADQPAPGRSTQEAAVAPASNKHRHRRARQKSPAASQPSANVPAEQEMPTGEPRIPERLNLQADADVIKDLFNEGQLLCDCIGGGAADSTVQDAREIALTKEWKDWADRLIRPHGLALMAKVCQVQLKALEKSGNIYDPTRLVRCFGDILMYTGEVSGRNKPAVPQPPVTVDAAIFFFQDLVVWGKDGKSPNRAAETPVPSDADKLTPSELKSYGQYRDTIQKHPELDGATDRDVYDNLKGDLEAREKLPSFETWTRYLGRARKKLGKNKHNRRLGRTHGKTIVRADQL